MAAAGLEGADRARPIEKGGGRKKCASLTSRGDGWGERNSCS